MKLLLLGGTADARRLAKMLHSASVDIIYSVAGLVRTPDVECAIISGGFSQFGGLRAYLEQQSISAILDATHPYASTMTATAWQVAQQAGLPYWRFHRRAWQPMTGDDWHEFDSWEALLPALNNKHSVFLTAGQLNQPTIDYLARLGEQQGQRQLLRTAVQPSSPLPESMSWIKAIGPFDKASELALIEQHGIDVLVSKNSGGQATAAKLDAARKRGLSVLMLARPPLPAGISIFEELSDCCDAVLTQITRATT